MFFNGLRLIVAGAGRDVPMGAFSDGQVAQYDAAANLLKGGPAFSSGFAAGDLPVWTGTTFALRQVATLQTSTSTAYADITDLSIAINRTGVHVFQYWLLYQTSAAAEGIGFRLAFTGTATCDY